MRKKTIFEGALILTGAGILTRLLGFAYRIYMSGAIGAEGMGLYQLITPFYTLAWSIACSGVTTAVSRYVAAESAKKQYGNMGRALKIAVAISLSAAVILTCVMFFGAGHIASLFIHDTRTILSIKILSLALPFMAIGSAVRGYFLGLSQPLTPAVSQVLEQVVRMTVIYCLAGFLIPKGLDYACAAAVIGVSAEEAASCAYTVISYRCFKSKHGLTAPPTQPSRVIFGAIMAMALPLTANRVAGSLLSAVENVLIPGRLQSFGMTAQQAISEFGQVTGMALPLIFFPSALLTSLSIALVPKLSEAVAANEQRRISSSISKTFLLTLLVGMGAGGIFTSLSHELGQVIYNRDLSQPLFLFGLMCPLWYLSITISGVLNGLGHQKFIFKMGLTGSLINIASVWFFVPLFGIPAFIAGWSVSLVTTTTLSVLKITKTGKINFNISKWLIKPLLASAAASLCVTVAARRLLFPLFNGIFALVAAIGLICAIYASLLLMLGCVTKNDITQMFRFRSEKNGKKLKKQATQ